MKTLDFFLLVFSIVHFSFDSRAAGICEKHKMKFGLFSMKSDGTELTLLRETTGPTSLAFVHVSPNGKKIVFSRCIEDQNKDCICDRKDYFTREIVVSDLDGKNEVVASANKGGFNHYPNWSPDGSAVTFIHSQAPYMYQAGIYKFELNTKTMSKLVDEPNVMETDHYWNKDGSLTFLQNPIVDGQVTEPNNLFVGKINKLETSVKLTDFKDGLGDHCCAADPKLSPDLKTLSYAYFRSLVKVKQTEVANWDIILKSGDKIKYLGRESAEDYFPMWNEDSSRLMWVSYSNETRKYSLGFYDFKTDKENLVDMIGEKVEFKTKTGGFLFGNISWADWLHPKKDTVIFSGTYVAW